MSTISPRQSFSTAYSPGSPNNDSGSRQPTSPQPQPSHQQQQHKRVYQACIPCRRRKVKCDLGSVDNPSDPPCVRCRRESKECYFSATRRKRKLPGGEDSIDGHGFDEEYLKRNGRKRLYSSDSGSETPTTLRQSSVGSMSFASRALTYADNNFMPPGPLTPGGHIGRNQPLRRPHQSVESQQGDKGTDDSNVQYENPEAQNVMRREVYGPHDALDLLYKAATDNPGHKRVRSEGNTQSTPINSDTVSSMHRRPSISAGQAFQPRSMGPPDAQRLTAATTSSVPEGLDRTNRMQDPGYMAAIKSWARFRFVRAGWFTPAEAIEYIEYYYTYLSPLTPISPPTFRNPGTHPTLLTEEPILTVTLLTIASRYHKMPGAGGHCRSHAIHEQLWTYLRGMVERCLWGQEAFGGGFCGSGATEGEQTSSTAPWRGLRKGSLRTLGTVESLMILTEWHPRALHFPPAEATDELMLPSYEAPDNYSTDEDGNNKLPGGVRGKRIESWLEPAWRSDRMCWMLLSNAMGLSFELGVFDQIDESGGDVTRPEYEDEAYRLRAARIKKLLLIYVTQLAGRLGWTNMVPEHLRHSDTMEMRKSKTSVDGNTPGTTTTMSNTFNYIPDLELDDQIIYCWAGITNAMRWGNDKLFRSRKHTTEIIQSGRYIELLKEFQPMLDNWLRTFEGFRLPQHIRHILTIEFEYVRIYVNSLSLQAVVERCTNNAGNTGTGSGGNNATNLSPETQNYYGKLPLARLGGFGPADQEYIKEVVDGSRNLLRTVVDGLLPGEYLKHAPVRTYFRIISGAMFLLKTFALGASRNDVEVSIGLMDRAVAALRTCVVDDVHLGIRFSDLLETLTSRLRTRFMHAPTAQQVSNTLNNGQGYESRQEAKLTRADKNGRRQSWNARTPDFQESNTQDQNATASATPFDISQGTFYPNTSYNSSNDAYDISDPALADSEGWSGATDMWYLPPGAAFFQNSDQAITQTAEGVNVGGIDLLDYMAMDQYPGVDVSGMGSGF